MAPRVGAGPSFPDALALLGFPVCPLDLVCGPWAEQMGRNWAEFSRRAGRKCSQLHYEPESLSFLSLEPLGPCASISAA